MGDADFISDKITATGWWFRITFAARLSLYTSPNPLRFADRKLKVLGDTQTQGRRIVKIIVQKT